MWGNNDLAASEQTAVYRCSSGPEKNECARNRNHQNRWKRRIEEIGDRWREPGKSNADHPQCRQHARDGRDQSD